MASAAHIAAYKEINRSVVSCRQKLNPVILQIRHLIRLALAEAEYSRTLAVCAAVHPKLSVNHKSLVLSVWRSQLLQAMAVGNPKHNPFPGILFGASVKNLVHGSLVIHHVDSLRTPFHGKALRDIVILSVLLLLRFPRILSLLSGSGGHIAQAESGHIALKLLQLHFHIPCFLQRKVSPGHLIEAVFKSYAAQRAVVSRRICLQIGSQVRSLFIVEGIV